MIEKARILQLRLIITSENNCNEKLQENERYYKHIADKEYKSTCPCATAYHLLSIIRIVRVTWIFNTIIVWSEIMRE